jgi:hypothetical protein
VSTRDKIMLYVVVVLLFMSWISTSLWADVSPPPANQIIGIEEGIKRLTVYGFGMVTSPGAHHHAS